MPLVELAPTSAPVHPNNGSVPMLGQVVPSSNEPFSYDSSADSSDDQEPQTPYLGSRGNGWVSDPFLDLHSADRGYLYPEIGQNMIGSALAL
jgi:hypothetical protein